MSDRSGKDRRKLRRYLSAIGCSFRTDRLVGAGQIVNISKQGVFVRADPVPETAAPVELHIDPSGADLRVTGTVRWTTDQLPAEAPHPSGFGVLVDSDDAYLALYERILLS